MSPYRSGADGRDPVDWSVLAELAREMDDDSIGAEIVAIYLAELPSRSAALHQALGADDLDGMRSAAHALKSASATVGALPLSEGCRKVEQAAREDDAVLARAEAQWVLLECDRVGTALAAAP